MQIPLDSAGNSSGISTKKHDWFQNEDDAIIDYEEPKEIERIIKFIGSLSEMEELVKYMTQIPNEDNTENQDRLKNETLAARNR